MLNGKKSRIQGKRSWIFNKCHGLARGYLLIGLEQEAQSVCTSCLKFRVGRPSLVTGPRADIPDSQFVSYNTGSSIRGYAANVKTYRLEGPHMENLTLNTSIVIDKGAAGNFDECGAWLQAIEPDGSTIRGWYHAERECDYLHGQTDKSVAYAESTNGGITFTKLNYPNNQVLTGTNSPTPGTYTGAGDQSVIKWGSDYYMYFLDTYWWKTGVAKASVASAGKPGNWFKWYNGSFSSPGLAGNMTPLTAFPYLPAVSLFTPTNNAALLGLDESFGGLRLSFSSGTGPSGSNPTVFTSISEPLLHVDSDNDPPGPNEWIGYSGMAAPSGGKNWDKRFYLFNAYVQPNQGFDKRYLIRRPVDVTLSPSSVSPQVEVQLTRYNSSSRPDSWTTTAVPAPSAGTSDYAWQKDLGYILTKATTGTVEIDDCYISGWDDHFIGVNGNCEGQTKLRTLGYVYSSSAANRKPIYRCYNSSQTNHIVSDNSTCEGLGQLEYLIGYVIAEAPLNRYYSSSRQDSWSTFAPMSSDYSWQKNLGYIFTTARTGTIEIDDCYIPGWDDHFIGVNGNCEGQQKLRTLGYVYSAPAANTKPIYRCYNSSQTNHSVSDNSSCEGLGQLEWLVGYVPVY